jgi:hypothetical protein
VRIAGGGGSIAESGGGRQPRRLTQAPKAASAISTILTST